MCSKVQVLEELLQSSSRTNQREMAGRVVDSDRFVVWLTQLLRLQGRRSLTATVVQVGILSE